MRRPVHTLPWYTGRYFKHKKTKQKYLQLIAKCLWGVVINGKYDGHRRNIPICAAKMEAQASFWNRSATFPTKLFVYSRDLIIYASSLSVLVGGWVDTHCCQPGSKDGSNSLCVINAVFIERGQREEGRHERDVMRMQYICLISRYTVRGLAQASSLRAVFPPLICGFPCSVRIF